MAADARGSSGRPAKGKQVQLVDAIKKFPTPAARDYRSPNATPYSERGGGKKGEQLPNFVGGQLNPTWVEWLMGWPLGWTDLRPLGMDKFQEWRQQHGNCCTPESDAEAEIIFLKAGVR
jgi:DNA (cytosine-5)-methyltransferase 1